MNEVKKGSKQNCWKEEEAKRGGGKKRKCQLILSCVAF